MFIVMNALRVKGLHATCNACYTGSVTRTAPRPKKRAFRAVVLHYVTTLLRSEDLFVVIVLCVPFVVNV